MQQVKAAIVNFYYYLLVLQDDLSVSVGQLQTPRSEKKEKNQLYIHINAVE